MSARRDAKRFSKFPVQDNDIFMRGFDAYMRAVKTLCEERES